MQYARSAWKVVAMLLALAILSACGGADSGPPAASFSTATGTGNLTKSNSLWVVNLEGDYTDMGRQYGALLKGQLQALYRDVDAAVPASEKRDGTVRALMALRDPREKDFMRGVAEQTGLSDEQLELVNASLFFIYNTGCSVFGATGTQTTSGTTIAGRNFDNPRATFAPILSGRSALVIYNPRNRTTGSGATLHTDNAVAAMTQIGWFYGLTLLNSKGVYLEYNNGTNSIADMSNAGSVTDGLHQNLYAAFDSDTLEQVHDRLQARPAVATMTQVADRTRVWHYERSPNGTVASATTYARKLAAGEAKGGADVFYYDNLPDTDIFTNHFFFKDWKGQKNNDPGSFNPSNDSASRSIARLINMQDMARQYSKRIDADVMKQIMTTRLNADRTGGPFIGWELDNPDVTHFTSVTDVANRIMHVYPNVDAVVGPVQWSRIDIGREFR